MASNSQMQIASSLAWRFRIALSVDRMASKFDSSYATCAQVRTEYGTYDE
ncbi:MAG: hypothetical protein GX948_02745 [Clostridiaceae bacterium]|jgi:hypothetical protein|nr:hypothetical protein [Clostridia bacterium]NMA35758.1 hypothetical protein [Clostridiaceae bacterium]